MPLYLGKDGKQRATEANAGIARTAPTLYFGLLQTYPTGGSIHPTAMTLAQLVAAGPEFTSTSTWYVGGRKPISFGAYGAVSPLICSSNNGDNQWLNTAATPVYVGGLFICTAASGTFGELLWVGYPDIGTIPCPVNRGVSWSDGLVDLKVI